MRNSEYKRIQQDLMLSALQAVAENDSERIRNLAPCFNRRGYYRIANYLLDQIEFKLRMY